jgi:hypothetical protein
METWAKFITAKPVVRAQRRGRRRRADRGAAMISKEAMHVLARLYEDDAWLEEHRTPPMPPTWPRGFPASLRYAAAKQQARSGNVEPLRKLVVAATGDPEIGEFIVKPRGTRGARLDLKASAPFRRYGEEGIIATVRRIRQILREETGKLYGHTSSVEEIAAELFQTEPEKIRQIMKKAPAR